MCLPSDASDGAVGAVEGSFGFAVDFTVLIAVLGFKMGFFGADVFKVGLGLAIELSPCLL